ncbi:MAG: lipoyl domain-containing protein [Candidatus Omnitrophica bacterium]|nr:lipoyl domain-containing protein [Candidatus Omnitrophota bacterium]
MTEAKLPHLGEGIEKASISYWHKSVGDSIKAGEDLVELVTDKAAFNMPSPASGTLKEILAAEGDEVKVGQVLARIG